MSERFEDYQVGRRSISDTEASRLPDDPGTLELSWRLVAEGDPATVETIVTRCRRHRTEQAGHVHRHRLVRDRDGTVVQEATSTALVPARGLAPDPDPAVALDFCSVGWGRLLVPALDAHPAFAEATRTFDGALGLRAGSEEVQLRVYRGRVLEAARSTPLGATFTLAASELEWTELALAARNEFMARATLGRFSVSGNAHEYLRLTKALVAIVDATRALAAPGGVA
ncbi:hypothetical protein FSW04_05235 [Baekduia soli]|uniref:SCP2 sterol-binding domain-containing protein n=1 Tax=Baekduia soli TaxID=496014 RepID=A0A5B8U225_9ACTN|nr:hypothetical protein [Baekduia soli]QEC47047.1 hypothetical protein FSW04_05235 [Baekduia soli]